MSKNPTWDDVLKFSLKENPVIFDVGGYEGGWASIILERYKNCTLYIFEPVKEFYLSIQEKFANNSNVKVMNFGLSNFSGKAKFFIDGDGSSLFKQSTNEVEVDIVDIVSFIKDNKISSIDLMKLNIEGAEYDLLDYLLSKPEMLAVENLTVQFHTTVDNCVERRKRIQEHLGLYYNQIYNFEFIFEGWVKKQVELPEIYCIGDSHISIFSASDSILSPKESSRFENFEAINVGPILAHNLPEKGEAFSPLNNITPGRHLLVCFGEIDCRAQVNRRCINGNYEEVIKDIVNKYFEGLLTMKSRIPKESELIIFSVTPELKEQPHWYYYEKHLEAFDAPHGTLAERTKYKETFNSMVKQKSAENGMKYVSIYDDILYNGKACDEYYFDDIHLRPNKVRSMIKKAMIDNGFYKK
jgi:FkbM family methyltransferase